MKLQSEIFIPKDKFDSVPLLRSFVEEWQFKGLIYNPNSQVANEGYRVAYEPSADEVVLLGYTLTVQPTFAEIESIVVEGGRFRGIKLGVHIEISAANAEVPDGIRGRLTSDEEGNEVVRTWLEWLNASGNSFQTNATHAIFKGSFGGNLLTSEELTIIHIQTYASVVEWNDYMSIVAEYTEVN